MFSRSSSCPRAFSSHNAGIHSVTAQPKITRIHTCDPAFPLQTWPGGALLLTSVVISSSAFQQTANEGPRPGGPGPGVNGRSTFPPRGFTPAGEETCIGPQHNSNAAIDHPATLQRGGTLPSVSAVRKLPSGDATLKISRRLSHLRRNCCVLPSNTPNLPFPHQSCAFLAAKATHMMALCASAAAWRPSSSSPSSLSHLHRGASSERR